MRRVEKIAAGLAPQDSSNAESRLSLALTRTVLDNLRPNRLTIPFIAIVACAMFSQWVRPAMLAGWYGQTLLSLVPTVLVTHYFPQGDLPPAQARRWINLAAAANAVFVASWTSMGWWFWVYHNDFDHLLLQLGLATSLAAHATLVGPSRRMAVPAFVIYAVGMTLTPLQAHVTTYIWLATITPFYVGYVATMARQHHARARAALILSEEKNTLIQQLAQSKLESDQARDRAEAASLAKSQFLANMSHELRTPLNAIIGFSELISTRIFTDPEKHYEYAGLIGTSGHHLLALINDILDLAKIEAGRWRLSETDVDLGRLAGECLPLVIWKARENHTLLAIEIAEGLPPVLADERALKQIWVNLLSNAVKFTSHGCVTIFARQDDSGAMLLGVRDTGIGIAPEDQARVFESFGQGKHDVAIADKGTGLGLAIVKGLTQAHGGSVLLESELHCGTCVSIRLPVSRVRAARAAA